MNKPVIVDGEFVSLYRSRVTGSLDENIKSLEEMKRSSTNLKKHDAWETTIVLANTLKSAGSLIMEYGSTPYVGMAREKNGCRICPVQKYMVRTLL